MMTIRLSSWSPSRSCQRVMLHVTHCGLPCTTIPAMRIRNLLLSVFCLPIFSTTNASQGDQTPMNTESAPGEYVPQKHSKPTLADLLTIESSASIFYTYARETELSFKLTDENSRLTVFVPTNKAVMALARKPYVLSSFPWIRNLESHLIILSSHQGPDSGSKLSQEDFDKRTKRNVERWISAHIVPVCTSSYPCRFLLNFAVGIPIVLWFQSPRDTPQRKVDIFRANRQWRSWMEECRCGQPG